MSAFPHCKNENPNKSNDDEHTRNDDTDNGAFVLNESTLPKGFVFNYSIILPQFNRLNTYGSGSILPVGNTVTTVSVVIGMVVFSPSGRVEVVNSVVKLVKVSPAEVVLALRLVAVITTSTAIEVESATWGAVEVGSTGEETPERVVESRTEVNGELATTELIEVP